MSYVLDVLILLENVIHHFAVSWTPIGSEETHKHLVLPLFIYVHFPQLSAPEGVTFARSN
jgi:hypothetical protein